MNALALAQTYFRECFNLLSQDPPDEPADALKAQHSPMISFNLLSQDPPDELRALADELEKGFQSALAGPP